MQVAWLIVPWHHFAMHGLLIARECIYCAMSPWYLDGETIGWALFLLVRGYYYVLCAWTAEQWCVTSRRWLRVCTDTIWHRPDVCSLSLFGSRLTKCQNRNHFRVGYFADGECPWKFYEWILYRHLYMTKIFYIIQCGNENLLVQVLH